MIRRPPRSTLLPCPTLLRSTENHREVRGGANTTGSFVRLCIHPGGHGGLASNGSRIPCTPAGVRTCFVTVADGSEHHTSGVHSHVSIVCQLLLQITPYGLLR